MSVTVQSIVDRVLQGLQVTMPGEPIKAADAAYVLAQLNALFDDWNADGQASIAEVFTSFTTTGVNPETIGPTGTFVLSGRPVAIDGLAYLSGTTTWSPITVHDDAGWWLSVAVQNPGIPTEAYYSADLPNGSLYFSGVLAAASTVRVMTRTVLASVLLTQSVTLAPGYQSAIELTLMEAIAPAFAASLSAGHERRAGAARGRIFSNNLRVPTLSAAGSGLPGLTEGTWDARTGTWI